MTLAPTTHELDRQIAEWLSEARFHAGQTLDELSAATRIPQQKLRAMEMGLEPMSAASMLLIESTLGCGLPVFLEGEDISRTSDEGTVAEDEESQFEACLGLLLTLSRQSNLDGAYEFLSDALESQPSPKANLTKLRA